jgi:hypothetical protein
VALHEWGAWLMFAPFAFRVFGLLDAKTSWRRQVIAGIALALCAAVVPIVIDQWTQIRTPLSGIAMFWPRYVGAVIVMYLLWRVFLRATPEPAPVHDAMEQAVTPVARPTTLLVSKGADQCLLRLDEIQHASAAGNYIEIHARHQQYLVRSTMAALEDLLCSNRYVRIHRSHLVRVDEIERIRTQRSSSGTVHLKSGHALPLSKSYRAQLQQHKLESN